MSILETHVESLVMKKTENKMMKYSAAPGPTFYLCGICDHYHDALWNGDCRQDNARFTIDELDEKWLDWNEIDMNDVDEFQTGT